MGSGRTLGEKWFEDDNYKNKYDFWQQCISDDSADENDHNKNPCNNEDQTEIIITIDICVDNTPRIYYIDAYSNINTIDSNSDITSAIYLGKNKKIIEPDDLEYVSIITKLINKNSIKRLGETFILMIKNDDYSLANIDRDPIILTD